ncbi:hypothetical protein Tco_0987084 [Tanacetum coccineum]
MPKPIVNKPKVVSEPKVWSDAPIIEEYESDSEDEHVSLPTKEHETPSFAFINTVKHVKTPRQTVKEQNTCSQSPKPDKKNCSGLMAEKLGLGYGFTKKACFVCGSFSHLIRDCDFHEKRMAKQAKLNNRMSKGSGQREIRPVWNNVQRVNHQNQFVPKAVLTRTGKIQVNTTRTSGTNTVNTARTSGTNTVNTARHNFNRHAVSTNAARKVNNVKPIVNNDRPKAGFHKTLSPFRKPFNRTTTLRTNFSYQKVNTAEINTVSAIGGKGKLSLSPQQVVIGDTKYITRTKSPNTMVDQVLEIDYPQRALQNKGSKLIFDGMMRHLDAKKKFVMYPRFISVFLDTQLKNVPVPLDHFPINALTSKIFSFMVKKGKHFLRNVTPLFNSMLVQPTGDEGNTLERQSKPQPIPSPPHLSKDQHEPQTDTSLRPSPTTHIPDFIPEGSGGNHGGPSSSDRSLSGYEVDLDLFKLAIVLQKAKQIQDFGPTSGIRAYRRTMMMMKHHSMKMHQTMNEEYNIWAMEMEHYLEYIGNDVWKIIQNGKSKKRISTGKDGVIRVLPPVSAAEIHAVEKERKARTILLMAIPKDVTPRQGGNARRKQEWISSQHMVSI